MDLTIYKGIYQKALAELTQLVDRRERMTMAIEEMDARIDKVRQGIEALVPLCDEDPHATHPHLFQQEFDAIAPETGLTNAVRKVMANIAPKGATAVGVRTGLRAIGYEIKSPNILPSLHTILKRLNEKGELKSKDVEGRTWYFWDLPTIKKGDAKTQAQSTAQVDWRKIAEEINKS